LNQLQASFKNYSPYTVDEAIRTQMVLLTSIHYFPYGDIDTLRLGIKSCLSQLEIVIEDSGLMKQRERNRDVFGLKAFETLVE
jgi:hypothetical protein